jgi:K+-sensing histidine kinase KdpD
MQKYKNIKKAKDIDPFGLSLPVIKYLVEKQGGIMEVRSQKNQGSEITIIF